MSTELMLFTLGAVINLLITLVIVRLIYYPVTQEKTYVFTYLTFSMVIYFVMGLLTNASLSVGVGFGLFAIFSVLRYRTDEIPIREMTYLFIIIALPVMNSFMVANSAYAYLLVANSMVVALLYVLEKGWGFHFSESKRVTYDRIEWITPDAREELLADLRARTGLAVERVEVKRVDFLHDTAELVIYYDEPHSASPGVTNRFETQHMLP